MAWTEAQQKAIDLEGINIIVSAGAGSGKTAVLTERAKRKVLSGVHVNELLILTFTNAAAQEMKDRIRSAISKTPGLEEELNLVDGAYITTFDSFSLSMVKKYHTRLNITNKIKITDEVLIDMEKRRILDEIMDEHYKQGSNDFLKLINDFCLKDDKELKEYVLKAYKKIELKYDKTKFIEEYFNIYNENKINSFIDEYLTIIKEKQSIVKRMFKRLDEYFDGDFIAKMQDGYKKFLEANTYDEFLQSFDIPRIVVPRNSDEEGKKIKSNIKEIVDDLKKTYFVYENTDEIRNEITSTIPNTKIIFEIIKELDKRLDEYKLKKQVFNFNDISRLAIQVVENNPDIREELRNSFNEIMVDEYQDTSDTQEKFISLISNNNVYMVGDMKQSIYRFRNANPKIFKDKYDTYRDTNQGEKIDLLKNFRSRKEVLDDINILFDYVMDDKIGGADYQASHRMVFGNDLYVTNGLTNQNYKTDIITYNAKELGRITKDEEEAFIIGNDILDKINSNYQIFDKDEKILRNAEYKDFVILLDKSTNFTLYKKIFEYLHIPLTILKDESFKQDDDAYIFKNLLKLIICIKEKRIDNEFKYAFTSISRSFLYKISDNEIYNYLINNNYTESTLYKELEPLIEEIDTTNVSNFIRKLLNTINYDLKLLNISNIKSFRVRSEYFYNLSKDFEENGNTIYEFVEYLDNIFKEDYDLKFNINGSNSNSCMIMTIHKSKGLEYPICYFAGLTNEFNMMELKERIIFDNEYGLILPYVNESYKETVLKTLLKRRTKLEEISEKIRLFYVAVTRAKEKMIIVMPELEEYEEINDIVNITTREKYNSIYSIIKSIYSQIEKYTSKSNIIATKDYLISQTNGKYVSSNKEIINVEEIDIETEKVEEKHFSKDNIHLITKEEKEVMDFGTEVHKILEELDFNDISSINNISNKMIRNKVNSFINCDIMKNVKDKIVHKEYEFIYKEDNIINHGIIDLLLEDKEECIIIDYKLKNINDSNYDKQLNGYRKYIEEKTNKKVSCYLYSIFDEEYREVLK